MNRTEQDQAGRLDGGWAGEFIEAFTTKAFDNSKKPGCLLQGPGSIFREHREKKRARRKNRRQKRFLTFKLKTDAACRKRDFCLLYKLCLLVNCSTSAISVSLFRKVFRPHFRAASDLPRSRCFLAGLRGRGATFGVKFIKVVSTKVFVVNMVPEDVIDDSEKRMSNSDYCSFFPSSAYQTAVLGIEVGVFLLRCGPGSLGKSGAEPFASLGSFAALPFTGAFVTARTDSGPGTEVVCRGKLVRSTCNRSQLSHSQRRPSESRAGASPPQLLWRKGGLPPQSFG